MFMCSYNYVHVLAIAYAGSPESMSRNDEVISPTQNQAMSQVQRMGGLEEREREREELQQLETYVKGRGMS